ncbi:MAG: GNAT family N-acetyltransferase [Phycisphaerales bacterium]
MELPVIGTTTAAAAPEALVRAVKRANAELGALSAARHELEGGTLLVNAERPTVDGVNAVYDLRMPDGSVAVEVIEQLERAAADAGGQPPRLWAPNDLEVSGEFRAALEARSLVRHEVRVMRMDQAPSLDTPPELDLQILPARAAAPQYRELRRVIAAAAAADGSTTGPDELADCQLEMLDDTRLDMLVGRLDGSLVAAGGVFAAGEVGLLWDLATHPDFRERGVMSSLFLRLLELCARSQFKVIALECHPDNARAIHFYEQRGMRRLIDFEVYRRSGT